ncbi:MAG: aminotransferase class V-fold PLP-dependent enzyme [Candidatus Gracilibacteria bacterium]|nr:aminotransferase class V-fold PLP-dependent enzyme [Candidatus Gracilibacteria bacterium]
MNIKNDFPIFENNKGLIFFDSTSSTQKPRMVIEGIKNYLDNCYSNIHRGMYNIATKSEKMYVDSKQKVADLIGANSYKEVIYTYNSTYASNILTQSLKKSNMLKKGDKVLLSIVEHHANIVPWLILKDEIGIEIEYIDVDENYDLDFDDFSKKYDEKVKVISMTHVSNVTGQVFDLERIGKVKRPDTLFVIDASQSIPHFKVDVVKLNADFLFFTGHKLLADTGIGILWGKTELLEIMNPIFSGGGAIGKVDECSFTYSKLPNKFEPGTPNLTGALSLLKAIEYIESIGGYEKIEEIENDLVLYSLEQFNKRKKIKLIGSSKSENRVGVFSFIIDGIHSHDIADIMAENNICIRSGMHCAHPFLNKIKVSHTSRMSLYIYNSIDDVDKFFEVLDKIL